MSSFAMATLALLGSAAAAAQQQTVTLFFPNFLPQPLVASVAGSDSTATTYFLQCHPGISTDECAVGTGFTLVEGPKTVHFDMVYEDASILSYENNCIITGTATAICTETSAGQEAYSPGTSTTTFAQQDFVSGLITVTVTAGDVSVPASTAASATAPTASATTGTAGATGTVAAGSTASAGQSIATPTTTGLAMVVSTGTASVSGTASSSASVVSTGGMPRVTGNVEWIVSGAAIVMALAGL